MPIGPAAVAVPIDTFNVEARLRVGEATGLRWEDLDLTTGEMRIRQQLQAVGKHLVAQELKTEKSCSSHCCCRRCASRR